MKQKSSSLSKPHVNSIEYSHLKSLEKHLLNINSNTKTRLEALIDLLVIPPSDRKLNDILLVKEELKELKYFKKLVLGDDFLIVCKNVELIQLEDCEVLFHKGDTSEAAFIILKGNIDVILTRAGDEKVPKMYDSRKVLVCMQNGQLFGEIGLANQEATVRTATCVAKGPTYVAVIKKQFWGLIDKDNSNTSEVAKDLKTLQLVPGLRQLPKEVLVRLYDNSQKESIPSGMLLFEQGQMLDFFYVVLKGKVMIARTFKIPRANPHFLKKPNLEQHNIPSNVNTKDKIIFDEKTLEIDRLEKRDSIGDYCFVFKEELPYSVVTLYPVKLLKIPLDEIKMRLSDDHIMEIVDAVKLYPKDEDILRIHTEKERWLSYCGSVMDDVQNQKHLTA